MSQRRAGPCGLFSRAEEKKRSDDVIEGGFYFVRDSLSNFISRPPPDSDPLGNGECGKSCAGEFFTFSKVGISLTGTMRDAIRLRLMGNSSRDESKDLRTELNVAALA